ncbi:class I SAM-dependent methyltransferase [Celerinatantimonas yamalensis]|uniref:Methyltransferase domain-containing protein n=1 Tax=Celerinatantimonas yamalensis TaxID=559956 RepID=A0ABW9GAL1_9GAMM
MKPAKISRKIIGPLGWQEFSGGNWLRAEEQVMLDRYLPKIFGFYMLKLGHLSGQMDGHHSMIRKQVCIAPSIATQDIVAELTALPIQESSVDLCLLNHTLDFSDDPHQILREVERVLTQDGYLILSGFNPMSLMGIRAHLGRRRIIPWSCQMFTPMRVRDWLNLLGFEVLHDERYAFTGFTNSQPLGSWFEQKGRLYARPFSSCYLMVARKRTVPLTPIRQKWQLKKTIAVRPLASS